VPYISGESAKDWRNAYRAWCDIDDNVADPEYLGDLTDAAVAWSERRRLDSAYLSPSTNIAIWSDRAQVHIEWDNRDRKFDGKPAWSAAFGSYQLPRDAFIAETRSFHVRLIEQMAARVDRVLAGCLAPDIHIDLPGLVKEQEKRARSLDAALKVVISTTDWLKTEKAIHEILKSQGGA